MPSQAEEAEQVKAEIKKVVNDVDASRTGHLTAAECQDLYKQLGWSDQDIQRLFEYASKTAKKSSTGEFTSDELIDWMFSMGKRLSAAPSLGVIRLDYDYPPAPGDIDHSGSYMYDVYYRVVPGLTFEMCQSGKMTERVTEEFIDAVKFLDSKGVSGITGDCGFMMWFQALARKHTNRPVFMSALAHLPAICCATADKELIAIFTANGKTLEPMRDLIRDECSVDTESARFIVVGCEDVEGFEAVALGEKVDVQKVQPGMVNKANQVIREHPRVRAILMECTELPPYSDALRCATGLPVFDAITCADFYIRGFLDHPVVGESDWQMRWDGKQEDYTFGANLTDAEKSLVVNKHALTEEGKKEAAAAEEEHQEVLHRSKSMNAQIPEWYKDNTPVLGVLRVDYDYSPVIGDPANPRSFAFPVVYRVVSGLTYEMCVSGKLSEAVQEEWIAAVKYLDDRGVAGITADLEMCMWFQELTRQYTILPCFLSPVVQLPAITSAFAMGEMILVVASNKREFLPMLDLIRDECGVDPHERRFIIMGVEEVPRFQEYLMGDKSLVNEVGREVNKLIQATCDDYHTIRAVLMASTVLSPFSDEVRRDSGLPVFDVLTLCDLFINGRMDNSLFGLQAWQKVWDGYQQEYVLGQNLPNAEPGKVHIDSMGREARTVCG